jgi:hypothetical protein
MKKKKEKRTLACFQAESKSYSKVLSLVNVSMQLDAGPLLSALGVIAVLSLVRPCTAHSRKFQVTSKVVSGGCVQYIDKAEGTLGENHFHLKLWRHWLLSVVSPAPPS